MDIDNQSHRSNDFLSLHNKAPKRDARQEMILYFYSSMLQSIIKEKESTIDDSVQSIPSAERILTGKNFEPASQLDELGEFDSTSYLAERSSNKLFRDAEKRKKSLMKKSKQNLKISQHKFSLRRKSKTTGLSRSFSTESNYLADNYCNWMLDHIEENVKIKFSNGNKYEGTIYCNMLHGKGKFTWSNGTVYEGEFKNNEITGRGRFEYLDQSVYTGEVYKNYCHGSGILLPSESPCIYKGNFHLNVKQGFGWQFFGNDNTYEGEWVNEQMNGLGYRIYPSGAKYYGKFFMGKRHGYGVALLKNRDVYAGEWVQGKREGFGDYIWNVRDEHYFAVQVQSSYYGSWVDNKRDGIGVINFGMEGGSRYAGYFANNEKHGSGVIICENGNVIESNPLFLNDKPVHLTECGNVEKFIPFKSETELSVIQEEEATKSCLRYSDDMNESLQESLVKKITLEDKLPSSLTSEQSTIYMCKMFNQNKYNFDIFDEVFPKIMDQYSSMNIPIGVSSEQIDLNTYIYKIIENKSSIHQNQSYKIKNYSLESQSFDKFISYPSSTETYSDYDLHKFEERLIRKSINKYLRQLKRIYYLYASIGCIEENITFKPWLMRICFWQLYRDCKIPEKGISLIDIDLMFAEKSTFDSFVVHNPFEVIYFCQYLENLLYAAFALYGDFFITSDDGVLKQSFDFFMENDILPNAGHFRGSAMFEYRDVIPIKAAYAWYRKFGEPHSVKQFLGFIFKKDKPKHKKHHKEVFDTPYIQDGHNVINCGNKLFYFEDEECLFSNKPTKEKVPSVQHKNMNKLNFLSVLKTRQIAKIIYSVCPMIRDKKNIINFEYKLSFLEFYEIVLLCTQEKLKIQMQDSYLSLVKEPSKGEVLQLKKKERKKNSLTRKSKKAQG